MSLQPLEMKTTKRLSTIGVGTHLCIIYSLYYLKNAAGTEILVDDKYKVMVVVFTKDKGKEHHEQHYVIDGVPVTEDGEPVIEHFIFKMNPYIDNGKRPKIAGDPLDNNGIASGEFVEYKNIAVIMKERNRVNTVPDEFKTRPLTNDQIERLEAAKEIIKNVESGIKPEKPVEQPKIDDIDWGEEPNF